MKNLFKTGYKLLILIMLVACNQPETKDNQTIENHKIVSLNGTITEIICELGLKDSLVGVDVTSTFPASIQSLPVVGHVRNLSAEGIISLFPTEVLGLKSEINPELVTQLEQAGIKVKLFDLEHSKQGAFRLIDEVTSFYNIEISSVSNLKESIENDLNNLQTYISQPKILFIYARGGGNLMVGGKNTSVDKMFDLVKAENAVKDFEDFKPLTPEALIQANPDIILLFEKGIESIDGVEGLLKVPGIAETNAGKNRKFISIDGQLLTGFGPRLGLAAKELNQKIINTLND
jgi:iron complex transport system substrate-binding protein